MERQNKSRLLVCLSCVLITLSVLLLPLAFFETNIFVKLQRKHICRRREIR